MIPPSSRLSWFDLCPPIREAHDAKEGVICHEGVETVHDDRGVQALQGGLDHSEMDATDDGSTLPRHVGEGAVMEKDSARVSLRERLRLKAEIVKDPDDDSHGGVGRRRLRSHGAAVEAGRPAAAGAYRFASGVGYLVELARQYSGKMVVAGIGADGSAGCVSSARFVEDAGSTRHSSLLGAAPHESGRHEDVEMHPRRVALQADRLCGLGGVEGPSLTAEDGEQLTATLVCQGAVRGGIPTPGPIGRHADSIAQITH
jgi:hypothetical protein